MVFKCLFNFYADVDFKTEQKLKIILINELF